MRRAERALGAAMALVVAACSSPPPPKPSCKFLPEGVNGFAAEGEAVEVVLTLVVGCPDGADPAPALETITTQLLDPDNAPVPHSSRIVQGKPPGLQAAIRFTASRPGGYFASASFEPSLGTTSGVIQVAESRADAGVRVFDWPGHPPCESLALTSRGTVLCGENTGDGNLSETMRWVARRDGGDERFDAGAFAAAGDVVWDLDGRQLRRRVDDGAAMVMTHAGAVPVVSASWLIWPTLAARTDDAWVFDGVRLIHATLTSDGGLDVSARALPLVAGAEALRPGGVLVRGDDVLMVTGMGGPPDLFTARADDGGFSKTRLSGTEFVGSDGKAVWVAGQDVEGVGFADTGVRRAQLGLRIGHSRPSLVSRAGPPLIPLLLASSGGPAVPRLLGTGIVLEAYPQQPGFRSVSLASGQHAFAWSLDGGALLVYDRP